MWIDDAPVVVCRALMAGSATGGTLRSRVPGVAWPDLRRLPQRGVTGGFARLVCARLLMDSSTNFFCAWYARVFRHVLLQTKEILEKTGKNPLMCERISAGSGTGPESVGAERRTATVRKLVARLPQVGWRFITGGLLKLACSLNRSRTNLSRESKKCETNPFLRVGHRSLVFAARNGQLTASQKAPGQSIDCRMFSAKLASFRKSFWRHSELRT